MASAAINNLKLNLSTPVANTSASRPNDQFLASKDHHLGFRGIPFAKRGFFMGPITPNTSASDGDFSKPYQEPGQNNTNGLPNTSTSTQTARTPIRTEEDAVRNGFKNFEDALNAGAVETNQLIDEAYNSSFDYLNQAENQLRSDLPNYLNEAEGNYNVNSTLLGSQRDSAFGTLSGQETMATQRQNEAAAANRRLYNELKMGYGQRFGGSSSAGQAASEIANVEQQRQQGKLQQDYGNTLRQIEGQKMEIQKSYDNGIMQLQQQKQEAINQVNRDFQNKLLEINKNRADINMNKAQARLSALQNLRNQIFQINVQNMQFQQTLAAQKQQAEQGVNSYASSVLGATNTATDSTNQFLNNTTTNPTSNLQASQLQDGFNSGGLTPLTGQINKKDDPFGSLIGSIGGGIKSSFDFLRN